MRLKAAQDLVAGAQPQVAGRSPPLPSILAGERLAGGRVQLFSSTGQASLRLAADDQRPHRNRRVRDDPRGLSQDARRAPGSGHAGCEKAARAGVDPLQLGQAHDPRPGRAKGERLRVLPAAYAGLPAVARCLVALRVTCPNDGSLAPALRAAITRFRSAVYFHHSFLGAPSVNRTAAMNVSSKQRSWQRSFPGLEKTCVQKPP